jgi:hypothetical protein
MRRWRRSRTCHASVREETGEKDEGDLCVVRKLFQKIIIFIGFKSFLWLFYIRVFILIMIISWLGNKNPSTEAWSCDEMSKMRID